MFKPMLAATLENVSQLRFPLLASAKLDGLRCVLMNGVAYSRNLKPFRNAYVQEQLSHIAHYDLDGELIVGAPNQGHVLGRTQSGIMSRAGEPDFTFHVFDRFTDAMLPFAMRVKELNHLSGPRVRRGGPGAGGEHDADVFRVRRDPRLRREGERRSLSSVPRVRRGLGPGRERGDQHAAQLRARGTREEIEGAGARGAIEVRARAERDAEGGGGSPGRGVRAGASRRREDRDSRLTFGLAAGASRRREDRDGGRSQGH